MPEGRRGAGEARRARLAAALRDNLKKRKQQVSARARAAGEPPPADRAKD
ncbi:MAG: hypothetical protein ACFCUO_01470 [Rhodospirillales bacterium]